VSTLYTHSEVGVSRWVCWLLHYWLGDAGPDSRHGRKFFLLRNVQTGPRVNPTTCSMGDGVLSSGVKRSVSETDPSTTDEIKNEWSYTSPTPYSHIYSWRAERHLTFTFVCMHRR
jgi:hypothetical protein